jgi:hypothetical protein
VGDYEKTTSRRLLVSKIRVDGYMSNFLLRFFIAHLKHLEDFIVVLTLSLQGVNISFSGG